MAARCGAAARLVRRLTRTGPVIDKFTLAVERVARTSLREMIGTNDPSRLLSDRQQADIELQRYMWSKSKPKGSR